MFITFEGGEGSGKTTIINSLNNFLASLQHQVVLTREPGGTRIGEKIRDIILDAQNIDIDPYTESILFAASRAQHLKEVIIPALQAGKIVICDRFLDSSIAYQAYARHLGLDFVLKVNNLALQYQPDITFYIDLDPIIGLKRISTRDKLDRLDRAQLEFHQKVRAGYLTLAKDNPQRIIIIDGNQSKEQIARLVIAHIQGLF
ncbi:MAG: dTMP kinase [Acholeplasmatales bacterium]|jgi:dTMP kinase|nr:dTMP kinase [Acholeplasmatales bacterium]